MRHRIQLLGGFQVLCDAEVVSAWPRAAPRRLLKLIALAPRRSMTVDDLCAVLWPGDEGAASRKRLHHVVYLLRSTLETAGAGRRDSVRLIESDGTNVRLNRDECWVDVEAFEGQLDAALRRADLPALRAALALYTGPLLPGDTDDEPINTRRVALERRFAAGLRAVAQACQQEGELTEAVGCLQRVVDLTPADEVAHCALIELFARLGRRDEAERQYAQCRAALTAELGVLPSPATHRAYRDAMLQGGPAPDREGDPGRRPGARYEPPAPLGPLIDRADLTARTTQALTLDGLRLVTLAGPGGIGKTQLALHLARELASSYRHGVCFVSLAEVEDDGVADRFCRALRVAIEPSQTALDALTAALQDLHLLVVCDNCEHVVGALGFLTPLLVHCPGLQLLATSRRRLNLHAERLVNVPGLAPTRAAGIQLFLQRARAVDAGFGLDVDGERAVHDIVVRLDGIPLAIELVAARVQAFGPIALREMLALDLATAGGGGADRPPRHRSLEDSIAWSLALLTPAERHVLDCCALFAAPFEPDALLAVSGLAPSGQAAAVHALVELNLLARAPALGDGAAHADRLCVLASTHQVLRRSQTDERPGADARQRFARWFAQLAMQLYETAGAVDAAAAQARFRADHDNFFAALQCAEQLGAFTQTCDIVQGSTRYWVAARVWTRAQAWVDRAAQHAATMPELASPQLWLALAAFHFESHRFQSARALAARAMQASAKMMDDRLRVRSALLFSAAAYHLGDGASAFGPLHQARAAAIALGDDALLRVALNNLGSCHLAAGAVREAHRTWKSCDRGHANEYSQSRVSALHNLSLAEHYRGRLAAAMRLSLDAERCEASEAPRPARLTLILVRRSWMWTCRGRSAEALEVLARARNAAAGARLAIWERVCDAHAGKAALAAGRVEQAAALLEHGINACSALADSWDLLDLRLWLFWARRGLGRLPAAGEVLQDILALPERSCAHEHPRILEAAAVWLADHDRLDAARLAWSQAEGLRQREGTPRFPLEQRLLRATRAMTAIEKAAPQLSAMTSQRPSGLAWLAPRLA